MLSVWIRSRAVVVAVTHKNTEQLNLYLFSTKQLQNVLLLCNFIMHIALLRQKRGNNVIFDREKNESKFFAIINFKAYSSYLLGESWSVRKWQSSDEVNNSFTAEKSFNCRIVLFKCAKLFKHGSPCEYQSVANFFISHQKLDSGYAKRSYTIFTTRATWFPCCDEAILVETLYEVLFSDVFFCRYGSRKVFQLHDGRRTDSFG